MCASMEASTTAMSTSLCTTSSTVVTSCALPRDHRFAWFEIDLQVETFGEPAQHLGELARRGSRAS